MSEEGSVLRFYLDADVDVKLAANLRKRGFDCISAREIGNDALSDEAQMVFATDENRTLITHNIQDFVPIFERWWHAERNHPGIIVSQQIPLGELQRRVIRLLDAITADEMKNNLRNLGEFSERSHR